MRTPEAPSAPHPPPGSDVSVASRSLRAARLVAKSLGLVSVFFVAVLASVWIHMGLPAPVRAVVAATNSALAGTLRGTLRIVRVGGLSLRGLRNVDLEVRDADGKLALRAEGASVRIDLVRLLRSLRTPDRLELSLPEADAAHVEVWVEKDSQGFIGLVRAFEPRVASPPGPRGVYLDVERLTLPYTQAHVMLADAPKVDIFASRILGRVVVSPEETRLYLHTGEVHTLGIRSWDANVELSGSAIVPTSQGPTFALAAHGTIGPIPFGLEGSLADKAVTLTVHAPDVPTGAFSQFMPIGVTVPGPVSAELEITGSLPTLRPALRLRVGPGEARLWGTLQVPREGLEEARADVRFELVGLDPSLWHRDAPEVTVDTHGTLALTRSPDGRISGETTLASELVRPTALSPLALHASAAFSERAVDGNAQVRWGGTAPPPPTAAPATAAMAFHLASPDHSDAPFSLLALDTAVSLSDVAAIPGAPRGMSARVRSDVQLRTNLATQSFDAAAVVRAVGIHAEGVFVDTAELRATGRGTLPSPTWEGTIHASGLRLGGRPFRDFQVRSHGDRTSCTWDALLRGTTSTPTASSKGSLAFVHGGLLGSLSLTAQKDHVEATLDAPSVSFSRGSLGASGVRITGLGEPVRVSASVVGARTAVRAWSRGIELARIDTLLGLGNKARGRVLLDVDLDSSPVSTRGHIRVRGRELSWGDIRGADTSADVELRGQTATGTVDIGDDRLGRIHLQTSQLSLPRTPLAPAAWRDVKGSLGATGTVALAEVLARFPIASRPKWSAEGTLSFSSTLSRVDGHSDPEGAIRLRTKGLVLRSPRSVGESPWELRNWNLSLDVQRPRGASLAEAHATVSDPDGTVATMDVSLDAPMTALVRHPEKWRELVGHRPVSAEFRLPKRSLDALPNVPGKPPIVGSVEASASLSGTLVDPRLRTELQFTDLRTKGQSTRRCLSGVSLQSVARYDGTKIRATTKGELSGRDILTSEATMTLPLAALLDGTPPLWEAGGDIRLTAFPMEPVGALVGQRLAGDISGSVELSGLGRDARIHARLDAGELSMGRTRLPNATVHVTHAASRLIAYAQLAHTDGELRADVSLAMPWGSALVPKPDETKPADLTVSARNFRLDSLRPWLRSVVTELEGRIDGSARIRIDPLGRTGSAQGTLALRDGVVQIPALGERFHSMDGKVAIDERGTIRFSDFSARGSTGQIFAHGSISTAGMSFQSATATVTIPKGKSIPLSVEGVPMGKAHGTVSAEAKMSPDRKRLSVTVEVPTLRVELPKSAAHAVQSLDPNEHVRIGTRKGDTFVQALLSAPKPPRAASEQTVVATINMGNVEVVRDTTLDVFTRGKTTIELRDKMHVAGEIHVIRGKLDVSGKQFTIDTGVVSFVGGDPANPLVMASAYWDAPNGTRVHADFSGHVRTGKLSLRSVPALSQDEILSLLLFGSADASFGTSSSSAQRNAAGLGAAGAAGGVLTQGINQLFAGVTAVDISTRIDSSTAGNPRPEVVVQVTPTISTRLGYKLGVPGPGDNPDRAELTLDWRFVTQWSLSLVVGDQGSTAVDVLWRLRY